MKPRLLDLFCGGGGCTKGYQTAGFYVVGVDLLPQPNYCGDEFVQADALKVLDQFALTVDDDRDEGFGILSLGAFCGGESPRRSGEGVDGDSVDGDGVVEAHGSSLVGNPDDCALPAPLVKGFDAIHASPPCQHASALSWHPQNRHIEYPNLIAPVREGLRQSGLPYVIENVVGADLDRPVTICGAAVGLDLKRHRLFETSFPVMVPPCACGSRPKQFEVRQRGGGIYLTASVPVYGTGGGKAAEHWAAAMGIDWMTRAEMAQAIPPAYTEHIGFYLMAELKARAAA